MPKFHFVALTHTETSRLKKNLTEKNLTVQVFGAKKGLKSRISKNSFFTYKHDYINILNAKN